MKPFIVINAKTYPQTTGDGAVALARACDSIVKRYDADIMLAVQAIDLVPVLQASRYVKVCAQHVDPAIPGRNTGFVVPENLRSRGITWTIINHSEHKVPFAVLSATMKELRKNKFSVIICASSVAEVRKVAALKPDYVAYEPPALIGGEVSVSDAQPSVIANAVKAAGRVKVLVGAGVQNGHDVRVGLEHGAYGVLAASHVAKAKNPKNVLKDLCLV